MKCFFLCIICLFCVTPLFSDTIAPPIVDRHSLEQRLKRRKILLDSILKSADAFMDSITGKKKSENDTLIMLYNYQIQKKREDEAQVYWCVKAGSLLVLLILSVGFLIWKYR